MNKGQFTTGNWKWIWLSVSILIGASLVWWVLSVVKPPSDSGKKENARRNSTGIPAPSNLTPEAEVQAQLQKAFSARANALINHDIKGLRVFYSNTSNGRKALKHESDRIRYVSSWLTRRRAKLVQSDATLLFDHITISGNKATVNLKQSATLAYTPKQSKAEPYKFGIGTRHRLTLTRHDGQWVIDTDEFSDPLAEEPMAPIIASLHQEFYTGPEPTTHEQLDEILALPATVTTSSYNRQGAVDYANSFCGAASGCGNNRMYNTSYVDLTKYGGDCTNFVSQVLGDPAGGGLAHTKVWTWLPGKGMGTPAWQQTTQFAAFLQRSGYGRVLTRGKLAQVIRRTRQNPQGAIGRLRPGDVIGYEEDGRIAHFAVVTGKDNQGQPVVNSHTSDRYHVPWEIGWNEKTTYWLFAIGK